MTDESLSHVDADGRLQMVDVSAKPSTQRTAQASCIVVSRLAIGDLVTSPSGLDPVLSARLSGIRAAKDTARLIPLCHPLEPTDIQVDVTNHESGLEIMASVSTVGRTGVEMEALTACGVCAVSIVESARRHDENAQISRLQVLAKTGGKSDWGRDIISPT